MLLPIKWLDIRSFLIVHILNGQTGDSDSQEGRKGE